MSKQDKDLEMLNVKSEAGNKEGEEESFNVKAKKDFEALKEHLNPTDETRAVPIEEEISAEFLKDPSAWLKKYDKHLSIFTEDSHYLDYVAGLLDLVVEGRPFGPNKNDICPPVLLLQKIVTVKALKERRDPMRTALKLQHQLRHFAHRKSDADSTYDIMVEELQTLTKQFSLALIGSCITPSEVVDLMHGDDHSHTVMEDVLQSQNRNLIASKFYQKMIWHNFWGRDYKLTNSHRKDMRLVLYTLQRIPLFFFWNLFWVFYGPIGFIKWCHDKTNYQRRRQEFFSPFSSYLADILNYSILLGLLLYCIVTTTPDHTSVNDLIQQYKNGTISVYDSERITGLGNGDVRVQLSAPTIPIVEWLLWACLLGRIMTECYQCAHKNGANPWQKFLEYIDSRPNIADLFLILLLVTGMVFKLTTYIIANTSGIFNIISLEQTAEDYDWYIPQELVVTISLYCTGAICALFNFLYLFTIHIPHIGPLLTAIQEMFNDLIHMLFIFFFFILGFFAPFYGMVKCYRAAHNIDGTDDSDDFASFKSISNSLITLLWASFGGLSYTARASLHASNDTYTTIVLTGLLVVYAVVMGLMCMNILIAMMCSTYAHVTREKSVDWRYSQFRCIMSYNANKGSGMPFIFPFCIPYILYWVLSLPCQKLQKHPEPAEDNAFAKFLCEHRLKEQDGNTNQGT